MTLRRVGVLALLLLAACDVTAPSSLSRSPSHGDDDDDDVTETKADAPAPTRKQPPSPEHSAAAPADAHVQATLDKTDVVQFGGGFFECTYDVSFSDVKIDLTMDGTGKPTGGKVTTTIDEEAVGFCPVAAPGKSPHTYQFDQVSDDAIEFKPDGANDVQAKLVISGKPETKSALKLHWERSDAPSATLGWKVDATVTAQ